MIRPLLLRLEVREEIDRAFDWLDQQRSGLGDEFMEELRDSFQVIRSNPEWYAVLYRGVRARPLSRFPYVVYFRTADERIEVIAVQHGRQNPRTWRSRA